MDEHMADRVSSDAAANQHPVMRRHRARHTKSRNGCYNCKLRRVKCDELQPACGTCSSRGERCSYPPPRAPSKKTPRSRMEDQGDNSDSVMPDCLASSDGHIALGATERLVVNATLPAISWYQLQHGHGRLVMDDLRLLQFYHIHTASQMSLHPRRAMVWQRIIPEFASRTCYLMHLLLALGGIHMITRQTEPSSNKPFEDPDTVDLAMIEEHHQRGLEGFREQLSCMSPTNADHVLAGSLLLVGFAFASLKIQEPYPLVEGPGGIQRVSRSSSTNEILRLNWLHLNRGVSSVIGDKWNVLKASRLRQMVVYPHGEEPWNDLEFDAPSSRLSCCSSRLSKFAEGAGQAIVTIKASLYAFEAPKDDFSDCSGTSTSQRSPSTSADPFLDAHFEALEILDKSYSRILAVLHCAATAYPVDREIQMDFEEAAILSWPVLLPSSFLLSLQGSEHNFLHGYSLVILAHFYLINTLVDSWFLTGSFEKEINKMNALIGELNDNLLSKLMLWPKEIAAMSPASTS